MMYNVTVGKDSMGNEHAIDLVKIPVLLVSYSNESQLNTIFSMCSDLGGYIITNSKRKVLWGVNQTKNKCYIKDQPELGKMKNRQEIFNSLLNEIKKRSKVMKERSLVDFDKYHSLNLLNKVKLDRIFLIIDDIWDIVISKPKMLSLNLVKIMLYGFKVGIHTIIASAISYRNILQQVINYHPALTDEIKNSLGIGEPMLLSSLGHELIFTAENFVYYKKGNLIEMEKFYSI